MAKRTLFSKPILSWWTPIWERDARTKRVWGQLLNVASSVRVLSVALLCCLVIVTGFRIAFPQLPLANLGVLAVQIPGLYVCFYAMYWAHRVVPDRVSIFDDCVLIQHGQSAKRIAIADIVAVRIVVYAEHAIRLRIWYNRRGRRKSTAFGLYQGLELAKLTAALGVPAVVYDARTRCELRKMFRKT